MDRYKNVSSDSEFPNDLRAVMDHMITTLAIKLTEVCAAHDFYLLSS